MNNARLRFILFAFLIAGGLLIFRLFNWQVLRGDTLAKIASSQHRATSQLPAHRGAILTTDGFPLASSTEAWLIWASLPDLKERESVAAQLAPFLVAEDVEATGSAKIKKELLLQEEERLKKLFTKEDSRWVPLKHKVSREVKEKIASLNIAGIGFDLEETRMYPEASMAAHLLGFVGKDEGGGDRGYFGLEGYYDLTLSGSSGRQTSEKDAFGNPILIGILNKIAALDGLDIKTHIDRSIQFILEKHLKEDIKRYGAAAGTVVIMRPQDGAILGMASFPSFDPLKFSQTDQGLFTNTAVSDSFEPGSVFKVLVMAAALDAGAVEPDSRCDQCAGPRRIAEYTLKTWNEKYYPDTTTTEIIQHSDNVGMIWVAEKLGAEKLYEYLQKFGIGMLTGVDLQGEANPGIRPVSAWTSVDLATAGFGQGVAVTPIQMLRAVGAIANGGRIVTPQVVDKIIGNGWEQNISPDGGQRVISEEASRKITEMMVNAVEQGEAKWAKPKGFKIAGKTGTAQIPVAGHYDAQKTIASFIGFAPPPSSDSGQAPKFVMMVTLREPKSSPWASETAAPLWFSIARDLFPYFGIQPE